MKRDTWLVDWKLKSCRRLSEMMVITFFARRVWNAQHFGHSFFAGPGRSYEKHLDRPGHDVAACRSRFFRNSADRPPASEFYYQTTHAHGRHQSRYGELIKVFKSERRRHSAMGTICNDRRRHRRWLRAFTGFWNRRLVGQKTTTTPLNCPRG
jgi:hypothetical protein